MRSRNCSFTSMLVALMLALTVVPGALAQCGLPTKIVKPSGWHPSTGVAHLARTAFDDDDRDEPSIVGMWHVLFVAHTSNGGPIPSNAYPTIDNALVVWHRDGTEIMNSVRPPQDGNFCMGVWERVGVRTYKLNHFAWFAKQFPTSPTDQGTDIGPSVGPTRITETITLSPDGMHYSGSFALTAYDKTNMISQTFTGVVTGKRITVTTQEPELVQ